MASELDSVWDGGDVVGAGAAPDNASEAGSTTSRASSKAKPKRAGRGKAKSLSTSFQCWQSTPEPKMNLPYFTFCLIYSYLA